MLILSRRIGETITIGDDITVTVLLVRGNQIRLGIHAPDEIPIHREEIYHHIKALEADRKTPSNPVEQTSKQDKQPKQEQDA